MKVNEEMTYSVALVKSHELTDQDMKAIIGMARNMGLALMSEKMGLNMQASELITR